MVENMPQTNGSGGEDVKAISTPGPGQSIVCNKPMSKNPAASGPAAFGRLPAPCLVDTGLVVNKADMVRLLNGLCEVEYTDFHGDIPRGRGTGYVMEVFSEPTQATLVANRSLYLNVCSFDYLELAQLPNQTSCFNLIQGDRCLRLVPLTPPQPPQAIGMAAIEAMVVEALSASWDVCLEDEGLL